MAIAAINSEDWILPVAFLPAVAFWGLDGYFLRQERLFRRLYDRARQVEENHVDYSMNIRTFRSEETWLRSTFSRSLWLFHGTLAVAVVVVTIILFTRG